VGGNKLMRSNGPVMLSLPPFRGVTRRLILILAGIWLADLVLRITLPDSEVLITHLFLLRPDQALGRLVWQFVTYPFMPMGLISMVFALLSLWFFGSALEDERGSRWLSEYLGVATVGGGVLGCVLVYLAARWPASGLSVTEFTGGIWPAVLALVLAYARFHAEEKLRFNFLFMIKAKFLAAIYLLFYLVSGLIGGDRFGSLVALCVAFCGWLFLQFAPVRGVRFAASETLFAMRNSFYRAKRRRAAKKFTVYMKKQGKDVNIDTEGRYVDPSGTPRDPDDRNWMN
jgi:membrane associated rhomboid family serine protease